MYPNEFFGCALIHFTGSKTFNATIREYSRKIKKFVMNDRGFLDKNGKYIK